MAYCTLADLEDAVGSSTVRELSADSGRTTADEGIVAAAIADAVDLIESYLALRYVLPLTPEAEGGSLPGIVRRIAVDLSLFFLRRRRGSISEQAQSRFDQAIGDLSRLSKGTAYLPGVKPVLPGTETPVAASVSIGARTRSRVFTEDIVGRMP